MTMGRPRRAVAIGGGTGMPPVLKVLVERGYETTAVVTMADDGGSTGMLRRSLGTLPPGDIRNCLVAMGDEDGVLGELFQYRFPEGEGLKGHSLGNLIITALADLEGGFVEAIEASAKLLGTQGTVLPSTLEDVSLVAEDASGQPVRGQAKIAVGNGHPIADVHLEPECPTAYEPALDAIDDADVILIGPGSLFTSIIPNFLVDGVADAVKDSSARRLYICNVANQRGETAGMDAYDHVDALLRHGLEGAIDTVLVHDTMDHDCDMLPSPLYDDAGREIELVDASQEAAARIAGRGVYVVDADMLDCARPTRHDPEKLRRALGEVC